MSANTHYSHPMVDVSYRPARERVRLSDLIDGEVKCLAPGCEAVYIPEGEPGGRCPRCGATHALREDGSHRP